MVICNVKTNCVFILCVYLKKMKQIGTNPQFLKFFQGTSLEQTQQFIVLIASKFLPISHLMMFVSITFSQKMC